MSRTPRAPEVGPWAAEKLDALRRYLEFYTTVLKHQPWRTLYVDAFAGGGLAKVRKGPSIPMGSLFSTDEEADVEQQEFIKGSPQIALGIGNPFDRYVFIDTSGARVAELEALAAAYGESRTISIRQGNAEEQIRWVLARNLSRATHRGVAFLDPFGAHLNWATVEALANTKLFEVLVNFPLHMAIVRLMKNDGDIPDSWRAQLDGFFGNGDWYDEVYEVRGGFFEAGPTKRDDYMQRLLELYRTKLKNAFGHVSQPKLIRNTKGAPLYYLVWAGPNRKGLEGANYILGMGERLPKAPQGGRAS